MWQLRSINLDTGFSEPAPPGHWESVIMQVPLSAVQVTQVLGVYDLYKEHMGRVVADRTDLMNVSIHVQVAICRQYGSRSLCS